MHASLRPLGIGEMLDRAVTLSVRYFVPLASIWAVYFVPLSIVGYFGTVDMSRVFEEMVREIQRGATAPHPGTAALGLQPQWSGATILYFVLFVLGYPLAMAALLRSANAAYLDQHAETLGASYAFGLRQWLPLIGVGALWVASFIILELAVILVVVLVGVVIGIAFALSKVLALVLGIPVGLICLAAVVTIVTLVYLSFMLALMTQVIENVGFIRAFVSGCARVIRTLRTSLTFGLALLAVNIGATVITLLGQSLLFGLLRSNVAGTAFSAIVGVLTSIFAAAVTTVYYYDVRVRAEGFDLALEAAADQ